MSQRRTHALNTQDAAIKLFDLLPKAKARPELVTFDVPRVEVLDAYTQKGVAALAFTDDFPYKVN